MTDEHFLFLFSSILDCILLCRRVRCWGKKRKNAGNDKPYWGYCEKSSHNACMLTYVLQVRVVVDLESLSGTLCGMWECGNTPHSWMFRGGCSSMLPTCVYNLRADSHENTLKVPVHRLHLTQDPCLGCTALTVEDWCVCSVQDCWETSLDRMCEWTAT